MINLRGLKDLRSFRVSSSAFFLNNKFQASVVFHWHFQPLYPPLLNHFHMHLFMIISPLALELGS